MVAKRSGTTEPFTRDKAVAGVRKACKGRPVSEDDLARLGQSVEDALRAEGWAEVPANEIGLAILGPLRSLDEVAWLRFASVYRAFTSAADFETAIAELRADHDPSVVKDAPASSPAEDARSFDGQQPRLRWLRRRASAVSKPPKPTRPPPRPPQPHPLSPSPPGRLTPNCPAYVVGKRRASGTPRKHHAAAGQQAPRQHQDTAPPSGSTTR